MNIPVNVTVGPYGERAFCSVALVLDCPVNQTAWPCGAWGWAAFETPRNRGVCACMRMLVQHKLPHTQSPPTLPATDHRRDPGDPEEPQEREPLPHPQRVQGRGAALRAALPGQPPALAAVSGAGAGRQGWRQQEVSSHLHAPSTQGGCMRVWLEAQAFSPDVA